MALTLDRLICEQASQSSPNKKYEIRLRQNDGGPMYLSCQCKAWTTASHQAGRSIQSRFCKHTDRALIERAAELKKLGYSRVQSGDVGVETATLVGESAKEFTPINSGQSRKIRK